MKKLYLLLLALVASVVANAATVYFRNTDNWQTVTAHMWNGNGGTSWPGNTVSDKTTIDGVEYYYVTTEYEKVIFNNGAGQQTEDLYVYDGAVYSYESNQKDNGTMARIGTIFDNKFNGEDQFIYFPVSTYNFNTAAIYFWEDKIAGNWPGKVLEKRTIDGESYWVFQIANGNLDKTFDGIQLNNNGNNNQKELKNITIKNGDVIDITKGVIDNIPYFYLRGDFNEWSTANPMELTSYRKTPNGEFVYTISIPLMSGEFKVADGNWGKDYGMADNVNFENNTTMQSGRGNGNFILDGTYSNVTITFYYNPSENKDSWLNFSGTLVSAAPVYPTEIYIRGESNNWEDNPEYKLMPAFDISNPENADKADDTYFVYYGKISSLNGKCKFTYNNYQLNYGNFNLTVNSPVSVKHNSSSDNGSASNLSNVMMMFYYNPEKSENSFIVAATLPEKVTVKMIDEPSAAAEVEENIDEPTYTDVDLYSSNLDTPSALGEFTYTGSIPSGQGIKGGFTVTSEDGVVSHGTSEPVTINGGNLNESTDYTGALSFVKDGHTVSLGSSRLEGANFTFNYQPNSNIASSMAIADGKTTGIENIVSEESGNGQPLFFNLQGVRVNNPSNGLFIRVQGNSSTKVIVK